MIWLAEQSPIPHLIDLSGPVPLWLEATEGVKTTADGSHYMPDSRRAADKIAPWVEKALDLHGQGEDICWEAGIAPDQQGSPGLMIVLWMPSGLLGQAIPMIIHVGNPLHVTEDVLADAVRSSIEATRQERSKLLAHSNGAGPKPLGPSGLVLP